MNLAHLALWHMRQEKTQRARATYKESRGEIGERDLALANADFHSGAIDAISPHLDALPDLLAHEDEINALQAEFRNWVLDTCNVQLDMACRLNDHRYDSVERMLSFSRAMAVGHPGVGDLVLDVPHDGIYITPRDFTERRLKVLRG